MPPYDNIWPHSSSLEFGFTNQAPYGQDGYVSDDQLKDLEGRPLYYTSAAATTMTTSVTAFPVYVRVGPWLAHLTPAAVAELRLRPGTPVWLVAKTHSWRVVAG